MSMKLIISRLPVGLRHAAAYTGALGVAKIISFIMVPVFTHHLSPADYGRLDVLQTMADLVSVIVGLSLADILFRFAGKDGQSRSSRNTARVLFGMAIITGSIFLVLAQILAPSVHAFMPGSIGLMEVRLLLAALSFSAMILVPLSWFRLTDRPGHYFVGTAGRAVLQASLAAALLAAGGGIVGVMMAGLIACITLTLLLGSLFLKDVGVSFSPRGWSNYARYGSPLIFSGVAMFFLSSCDRWLLAAFLGPEVLAPYAVAAKFALMTAVLLQPFEMWWFARRFAILSESSGEVTVARTAEIGLVCVVIAILAIACGGPMLIKIMTPPSYHQAVVYLPWLALLVGFRTATNLVNLGLYSARSPWRVLVIDGVTAFTVICLFLLLIPEFGVWGVVVAGAICLGGRLLATYKMSQTQRSLRYRPSALLALFAIAIVGTTLIGQAQSDIHRLLLGTAIIAATVVLAFFLSLLPRSWLSRIRVLRLDLVKG